MRCLSLVFSGNGVRPGLVPVVGIRAQALSAQVSCTRFQFQVRSRTLVYWSVMYVGRLRGLISDSSPSGHRNHLCKQKTLRWMKIGEWGDEQPQGRCRYRRPRAWELSAGWLVLNVVFPKVTLISSRPRFLRRTCPSDASHPNQICSTFLHLFSHPTGTGNPSSTHHEHYPDLSC